MKKTIILILSAFMAFSISASAVCYTESSALTDKKPVKKAKAEIKEVTFEVHLHCNNCVKKVQENIAFEKGVKDLHVCLEDQIVWVKYDSSKTNEDTLEKAIVKLGYEVKGKKAHGHQHKH